MSNSGFGLIVDTLHATNRRTSENVVKAKVFRMKSISHDYGELYVFKM